MDIRITCKGATEVALDDLLELQGNLKDLTEVKYRQLKTSILAKGFSYPIFMWEDPEGKKWIIDAHQRKRTLLKMREEGYTIPLLPADYIFAESKKDAKERILLQESKYGDITEEGLVEFMNEPGFELSVDELQSMITFPEFDMEYGTQKPTTDDPKEPPAMITCPNCQHQFTPNS